MPSNYEFDAPHYVDWRDGIPESPCAYWRFESFVDFESPFQSRPIASIMIGMWRVMRKTPKGVWLSAPHSNKWNAETTKKLVLHDTKKKYAYPTKKEAWESYCLRQERRNQYWTIEGERLAVLNALARAENKRIGRGF